MTLMTFKFPSSLARSMLSIHCYLLHPSQYQGHVNNIKYAAKNGHVEIVKLVLIYIRVDINEVDTLGTTPLHLAAAKGQCDVVNFLASLPN